MSNHLHTADEEFRHLLFRYMELAIKKSSENDEDVLVWERLTDILDQDLVSPATVIQCVTNLFEKYPSHTQAIIGLLDTFRFISFTKNNGYSYPEFLWILVKQDVFSKFDNFYDLMILLKSIVRPDILRAYLNYALLTEEEAKYTKIVFSYYYTGHDIESLKLVAQIIPVQNNNLDLLNYHYGNAMSFVFYRDLSSLTSEEISWLKSYFMEGLTLSHQGITESCKKALTKLVQTE